MSLHRNCCAVMEMPYKLMITAAVLAMVLPVMLESVQLVSQNQAERELEDQCQFLADTAVVLYRCGLDSEKTIELSLPDSTVLVSAGAKLDGSSRAKAVSIQFKITGGELHRIVVKSVNNYISLSSEQQGEFKITQGGTHLLQLKKCEIDLDLNYDGITPDYYIMITEL
ncbi:MAG: hypothetical protein JSV49_07650 [Thermoplasmata archaeon]|nr:MAG: hypothetical protein JSV49_07650 [Thermoplasmata archaeon]